MKSKIIIFLILVLSLFIIIFIKYKEPENKLNNINTQKIIGSTSDFIYKYHNKKIPYKDIQEIVSVSYECSFIFKNIGPTQRDRFIRILGWAETESGFKKNAFAKWHKGQKVKINGEIKIIKHNSQDFGVWQINNQHFNFIKKLETKNYKIKKIHHMKDLYDVKSNCIIRCIIETDRKKRGQNYKHDYATLFLKKLRVCH